MVSNVTPDYMESRKTGRCQHPTSWWRSNSWLLKWSKTPTVYRTGWQMAVTAQEDLPEGKGLPRPKSLLSIRQQGNFHTHTSTLARDSVDEGDRMHPPSQLWLVATRTAATDFSVSVHCLEPGGEHPISRVCEQETEEAEHRGAGNTCKGTQPPIWRIVSHYYSSRASGLAGHMLVCHMLVCHVLVFHIHFRCRILQRPPFHRREHWGRKGSNMRNRTEIQLLT